jgi:hypothetical protein
MQLLLHYWFHLYCFHERLFLYLQSDWRSIIDLNRDCHCFEDHLTRW